MERFVPIVHGVTAAFTVVELGLTAYRRCSPGPHAIKQRS